MKNLRRSLLWEVLRFYPRAILVLESTCQELRNNLTYDCSYFHYFLEETYTQSEVRKLSWTQSKQLLKEIIDVRSLSAKDFTDESGQQVIAVNADSRDSFHLTNRYIFSNDEFSLPVRIQYRVTFVTRGEFHPCWSKSKRTWNQYSCDALSWFLATYRQDFTFRTEMFGTAPDESRPHAGFQAKIGQQYDFDVEIHETFAQYSIDGEKYAECRYKEGSVPLSGHVGFGIYEDDEKKLIENVTVQPLQEKKQNATTRKRVKQLPNASPKTEVSKK